MVLGNENDYLTGYKRNSVTEWLQKTGQAKNDGNFPDGNVHIYSTYKGIHGYDENILCGI